MDGLLSLIFFILEVLIIIAINKYTPDYEHLRSVSVLIGLLASYQLAEFLVCVGFFGDFFLRIGFVVITFLPPMGLYLTTQIIKVRRPELFAYFLAGVIFAVYFSIVPDAVEFMDCNPLYAVYVYGYSNLYGAYYYFTILVSMILLITEIRQNNQENTTEMLFLIGYLAFLVPIIILGFLDSSTLRAIPSIMCKYAISLAVILGLMVYQANK